MEKMLSRGNMSYRTVEIDDSFPQYIIDNQEKYAHSRLNDCI